ncbi:MAG: hypothetical protein HYR85_09395 [Planctomycetes bacterium]|nr:hypothetical protein [Planctomycetota bacterium]MBI3847989.1 hypothetical protein [Planctomycetota bacterium]
MGTVASKGRAHAVRPCLYSRKWVTEKSVRPVGQAREEIVIRGGEITRLTVRLQPE